MRKWGTRSLNNLKGIHPDLRKIMDRTLQLSEIDFTVIEGLRTKKRQADLVAQGFSKTMNSRHLTGHAVDLWPIDPATGKLVSGRDDKRLWALYPKIAEAADKAAAELGLSITWGGNWKSFKDGPHFELPRKLYP